MLLTTEVPGKIYDWFCCKNLFHFINRLYLKCEVRKIIIVNLYQIKKKEDIKVDVKVLPDQKDRIDVKIKVNKENDSNCYSL